MRNPNMPIQQMPPSKSRIHLVSASIYRIFPPPSIVWKHTDGPLLTCSDGTLHWLTWWERFQLWRGKTTIEALDRKYRKDLSCI